MNEPATLDLSGLLRPPSDWEAALVAILAGMAVLAGAVLIGKAAVPSGILSAGVVGAVRALWAAECWAYARIARA